MNKKQAQKGLEQAQQWIATQHYKKLEKIGW